MFVFTTNLKDFKFPSILRNGEKREKWIGQLRRENKDKTTWASCDFGRTCSDHFCDVKPTVTHPFRQLKLDYEKKISQPRSEIVKHPVLSKKARAPLTHLLLGLHHAKPRVIFWISAETPVLLVSRSWKMWRSR